MKMIIVLCLCAVAVYGAPAELPPSSSFPAVEHIHEQDELGQYKLRYVTSDGTIVEEQGTLVPTLDGKDKVLIYEGKYTFVSDDGKIYVTKYRSDINGGYQVEGDHLPKPVVAEPVPEVPAVPEMLSLEPAAELSA